MVPRSSRRNGVFSLNGAHFPKLGQSEKCFVVVAICKAKPKRGDPSGDPDDPYNDPNDDDPNDDNLPNPGATNSISKAPTDFRS